MSEENFKPVDHLNKKYHDLIEPREPAQSFAEFFDTLDPKDATLCRIMTWYYKINQAGYGLFLSLGFDSVDQILKLRSDLNSFSEKADWKEIAEACAKIPEIIKHIAEKPADVETDEHDTWLDKMNDLNDTTTDMFMDSDNLFYEKLLAFYNESQNG